jgi:hypothetical protein
MPTQAERTLAFLQQEEDATIRSALQAVAESEFEEGQTYTVEEMDDDHLKFYHFPDGSKLGYDATSGDHFVSR